MPPSLREAHRRGLTRYLQTGQATILDRRIEMPAMRADGTEFPAEVAVTRTGLSGEAAFTAYVRDITDRQRAEQALMASRARLVTASDAARQRVTRDLHDGAQQHLVATYEPPACRAALGVGSALVEGACRPGPRGHQVRDR